MLDPLDVLRTRFGFSTFREGQGEVVQALVTGGRALAVFPTGSGKSLTYQLPSLLFDGVTLVVSPLIALMKDQIDFLTKKGIPAARLDSSLEPEEARRVDLAVKSGKTKLLFVAPERFANERFLEMLSRTKIALFAVDEAHCISEWGHNFRPDYLKLAEIAENLRAERVLCLTATATPSVVKDVCKAFRIPEEAAILTGFYRKNLELVVTPTEGRDRDEALVRRIEERPKGPTIVYVTLQKTAERVATLLANRGYTAEAYHAGLESEARAAVQDRFMAHAHGVVVATIAFGMGIDKANVRYVYHYNLPKSLESYSQEIGRAGRDGEVSTVEAFACRDDAVTLESFAYGDTPTEGALEGLVRTMLEGEKEKIVSLFSLSDTLDIRPIVLRTALTYLELDGYLRQKTPYYAGYRIKLAKPREEVVATFKGEPARFLDSLLGHAKVGRIWLTLDTESAVEATGHDRSRIVKALEVIEERGLAEVSASDLRYRFEALREADVPAVAKSLAERFLRRETQEIARVRGVIELFSHGGCLSNALVAHFGEKRPEPCVHCTYCHTKTAIVIPPLAPLAPIESVVSRSALVAMREEHPRAVGEPRKLARLLCGLTSPASSKAKLSRSPMFGVLGAYPFADVMAFCATL